MLYKKILHVIFAASVFISAAQAQTLFTYAGKAVSRNEFLNAFNKNPDSTGTRVQKLNEYFDMYINFKLKIQAAYDEKLDEAATFKSDSENFREQLAENNINNQANISQLMHEAFTRSQKDIQLAQILVEVAPGDDSMNAYLQIQQALEQLKKGKDFGEVSAAFSTDAATKNARGSIGFITVFTLPYSMENIVYTLQPGQYSSIYHSSIGYHIFKNVSERPALGKRKIQQILLPVSAYFNADQKKAVAQQADSVYALLQSGHPFNEIQQQLAPNTDGNVEAGIGEYSADFENQVFALRKPGDMSRPFVTDFGYHIIKLVETVPVSNDENDVVAAANLQQLVQNDNRLDAAKEALIQKWLVVAKYQPATYNAASLYKYTDAALQAKPVTLYKNFTPSTVLFSFAKSKITVADWIKFVKGFNESETVNQNAGYPVIMKQFINASCNTYYRGHIEEYFPAMVQQLHEFNEANLLFAAMDKHVWSIASADTAALKNYYDTHKGKYTWQPGVSALIVAAPSKQLADEIAEKITTNPADWRSIINNYGIQVNADSSRFENGQLPVSQQIQSQQGFQTMPEKAESGDAYTFVHVFDVFTQPSQRNFDEARGMIMNDYQQVLEDQWVSELRKKYPVKVDETVKKGL